MFVAKSNYLDIQQGKLTSTATRTGAGGGTASIGTTALTITANWTFDRDPSAPFTVTDTSAYVPNLFSEGVGNVTTDRLIGRDTTGTGESEQLTVGNGLEFTGSGGIGIANDGVTTARIINAAVTYAKIQDVSAASKLLGRGSAAGSGDVEEITLGTGLSMSSTTLNVTAALADDESVILAGQVFS